MSRTPLENAPKNRSILKIKDRFSLSFCRSSTTRWCTHVRTENQWEKKREKHRQRERKRERECATCVAAGVRLIVVSNRLYPGILIHSQLSALVAARDEQNVVRIYCEKQDSNGERIRDESPIPRCTSTIRWPSTYLPTRMLSLILILRYLHLKSGQYDSGTCAREHADTTKQSYQSGRCKSVNVHQLNFKLTILITISPRLSWFSKVLTTYRAENSPPRPPPLMSWTSTFQPD